MVNKCSANQYVDRFLIPIDKISNYVPVLSTFVNLFHLIQKLDIYFMHAKGKMREGLYINYISKKNILTCVFLIIPVISNLIFIFISFIKFFNNKENGSENIKASQSHLRVLNQSAKIEPNLKPATDQTSATSAKEILENAHQIKDLRDKKVEAFIALCEREEWFDPDMLEFEEFSDLRDSEKLAKWMEKKKSEEFSRRI